MNNEVAQLKEHNHNGVIYLNKLLNNISSTCNFYFLQVLYINAFLNVFPYL